MKFNEIWINEYLALVNDDNPIHNEIVPGQLSESNDADGYVIRDKPVSN